MYATVKSSLVMTKCNTVVCGYSKVSGGNGIVKFSYILFGRGVASYGMVLPSIGIDSFVMPGNVKAQLSFVMAKFRFVRAGQSIVWLRQGYVIKRTAQ